LVLVQYPIFKKIYFFLDSAIIDFLSNNQTILKKCMIKGMVDTSKFDKKLLDILVCPLTRSKLRYENNELVSETGNLRYPIKNGIPVLLIDEAKLPEGVESL